MDQGNHALTLVEAWEEGDGCVHRCRARLFSVQEQHRSNGRVDLGKGIPGAYIP